MISFAENVYFVEGATGACIYDLSTLKLYRCEKKEANFIQIIIGSSKQQLQLTSEEQDFLNQLIIEGLIVDLETVINTGDIQNAGNVVNNSGITFVWIEVTDKCNLRCLHCYEEAAPNRKHIMSYEDYKYAIDELVLAGIRKIQLIGGEPLILGDLLKRMIEYASGRFDLIEVYTNATLLTHEWASFLKKHQVHIALSVYSYDAVQHDYVTQLEGSHRKTIEAIAELDEAKIKYRTAGVLMKNVAVGEQGKNSYSIMKKDVVRMSGRANIKLLTEELIEKKLITKKSFSHQINKSLIYRNLQGHNCFSRRAYIAHDLTVYPCVMERRINHGTLRDKHLHEVLNADILLMGKNKIEDCQVCEYRYCCHDCRPDCLEENTYTKKPWYCTYNPKTGIWADKKTFIKNILQMQDN